MAKTKSRKKPGLFRRIFMGPSAAIVAAVIGGTCSVTAALVPRLMPLRPAAPEPVARAAEMILPIPNPDWSVPYAHELPPAPLEVPTLPGRTVVPMFEPLAMLEKSPALPRERVPDEQVPQKVTARSSPFAKHHAVNLTYGVWTIQAARDARGTKWNQSTLKITAQRETADGLQVSGYLDWRANGKSAGREYVVGNYVNDTRSLFIEGKQSAGNNRELALSACSARLSEDGRRLTGGTWGSASAHHRAIPGRWEAWR